MRKITLAASVILLAAPLAAQTSPQVTNDLTVTIAPQQYRICFDDLHGFELVSSAEEVCLLGGQSPGLDRCGGHALR